MKFPILLPNIFNYPFTYESDLKLNIGDFVEVPFGKSKKDKSLTIFSSKYSSKLPIDESAKTKLCILKSGNKVQVNLNLLMFFLVVFLSFFCKIYLR